MVLRSEHACPATLQDEYASLFLPRGSPSPPKGTLVASFRKHLAEWGPLLQRFLRSEDDQARPDFLVAHQIQQAAFEKLGCSLHRENLCFSY
eukprot:scaffold57776_cov18-Tisochrysis_lutea.AAC.1